MTFEAKEGLQVVFRRLDPLLQILLPLVRKFQEVFETESHDYSSLIRLIQYQTQVLQNLEDVLSHLSPSNAQSLVALADYVSLPLNAILHVAAAFAKTAEVDTTRQGRIFCSHLRRLNQSAAYAIQTFVQTCCLNATPGSSPSFRLKDTYIINFLVAIASVLPASINLHIEEKPLDDGLELCITLLGTIKSLIQLCSGMSLYDKWEGDLIIRIVDFGTSIDPLDNHHLSLLSLDVLDGLLKKVKKSQLWQRIFPGIFTYLHRRVIASGHKTTAGLSVQIESKSLMVLERLIKASIFSLLENDSMNTETNILRKSMLSAHKKRNARLSKIESNFLFGLRNRVAGPLSHLIRHSALSSSESVQLQVISLCETILVESRGCWQSSLLLENAFDVCLTLQSQELGETLANRLKSMISTIKSFQLARESWMIPRIQSLAEGTLSMAKDRFKQTEIRMQLQILMGYIRYLGTNGSAGLATSTGIRASFVALGAIDLESCSSRNVKKITNDQDAVTNVLFRHLSKDTGVIFRKVLRQYGSCIGWKHGSRLVDILLSDFCEKSFEHLISHQNFQNVFFHQHIGALVVCEEVIRGAYAAGATGNNRENKRKRDSLRALASSCLPLFVDASLWNIRTTEGSAHLSHPAAMPPRALHGNACVVALVLKVASAFFDVMGPDSGMLTHVMLCPIIEKASERNNDMVRTAAREAGLILAMALEFSSLSDMVQQNQSIVLDGLLGRFRSPPLTSTPNERLLRDALKAVQWVLLHTNASEEGIICLADFLSFIDTELDKLAICNSLSAVTIQDMTTLHRICCEHIGGFFYENDPELAYALSTPKQKSGACINPLSPYEHFSSPLTFERNLVSEKLALPHYSKTYAVGLLIISRIISREDSILSNCNLGLQVLACRVLSSAYQTLSRFPEKSADDTMVENAILKQAAKSWPSVKSRVMSVLDDVLQARKVKLSFLACKTSRGPQADLAASQYFLAELLELITVVCECCGNFMTTRFTKDVWPILARHLGSIIQIESYGKVISPEAACVHIETISWETDANDSERQLIVATLDCLGRVYCVLDLPEDILAAAAIILLPFLDTGQFGDTIGEKAMVALKRLADVNSDVIWRPLLRLLGINLPPFPINLTELARVTSDQSTLPQRAAALMMYINCLQEQAIY